MSKMNSFTCVLVRGVSWFVPDLDKAQSFACAPQDIAPEPVAAADAVAKESVHVNAEGDEEHVGVDIESTAANDDNVEKNDVVVDVAEEDAPPHVDEPVGVDATSSAVAERVASKESEDKLEAKIEPSEDIQSSTSTIATAASPQLASGREAMQPENLDENAQVDDAQASGDADIKEASENANVDDVHADGSDGGDDAKTLHVPDSASSPVQDGSDEEGPFDSEIVLAVAEEVHESREDESVVQVRQPLRCAFLAVHLAEFRMNKPLHKARQQTTTQQLMKSTILRTLTPQRG